MKDFERVLIDFGYFFGVVWALLLWFLVLKHIGIWMFLNFLGSLKMEILQILDISDVFVVSFKVKEKKLAYLVMEIGFQ